MESLNISKKLLSSDEDGSEFIGIKFSLLHLFIGVLLPIFCFAFYYFLNDDPDWQFGFKNAYFRFIFSGKISYVFYPQLFYSIISLSLVIFRPVFAKYFFVRFGIYSGVVLSYFFSLGMVAHLTVNTTSPYFIALLAFGVCLFFIGFDFIIQILVKKWFYKGKKVFFGAPIFIVILLLVVFLILLPIFERKSFTPNIQISFLPLLFAAPFLCFTTYFFFSIYLLKKTYQKTFTVYGIPVLWGAGFGLSLRESIFLALKAYQELPKTRPDCYLATVAAQGTPWLVGSTFAVDITSKNFSVNRQLQYFKAFEIVLQKTFPFFHKKLRFSYDIVGQKWAKKIKKPWQANLVYIFLKPAEWFCFFLFSSLLFGSSRYILLFYKNTTKEESHGKRR